MDDDGKAQVLALVWAYLMEHPEHHSVWVAPHEQVRFSHLHNAFVAHQIGGHWRRMKGYGDTFASLNCVCKFERLVRPTVTERMPRRKRKRVRFLLMR